MCDDLYDTVSYKPPLPTRDAINRRLHLVNRSDEKVQRHPAQRYAADTNERKKLWYNYHMMERKWIEIKTLNELSHEIRFTYTFTSGQPAFIC